MPPWLFSDPFKESSHVYVLTQMSIWRRSFRIKKKCYFCYTCAVHTHHHNHHQNNNHPICASRHDLPYHASDFNCVITHHPKVEAVHVYYDFHICEKKFTLIDVCNHTLFKKRRSQHRRERLLHTFPAQRSIHDWRWREQCSKNALLWCHLYTGGSGQITYFCFMSNKTCE